MRYKIGLQDQSKKNLLAGDKKYEIRVNKGKFQNISSGDILEIKDSGEKFSVVGRYDFPTFSAMLLKLPLDKIAPQIQNIEEYIQFCYSIYTEEQEKHYGIVAFELKRIS